MSDSATPSVHLPMVEKIEMICRRFVDLMEEHGDGDTGRYNIQNFLLMYIFASTTNTEYRQKLFDLWPTASEVFVS